MGYYRFCNNNEKFYGLIIQRWKPNNNNIKENSTWKRYLAQYEHTRATGQGTKPTTRCLKTQVSAANKANAQLDNQVGNGPLGHEL